MSARRDVPVVFTQPCIRTQYLPCDITAHPTFCRESIGSDKHLNSPHSVDIRSQRQGAFREKRQMAVSIDKGCPRVDSSPSSQLNRVTVSVYSLYQEILDIPLHSTLDHLKAYAYRVIRNIAESHWWRILYDSKCASWRCDSRGSESASTSITDEWHHTLHPKAAHFNIKAFVTDPCDRTCNTRILDLHLSRKHAWV